MDKPSRNTPKSNSLPSSGDSESNCIRAKNNPLKENELKYRLLFELANDAIMLMDKDKYIDCNKKALEMLGCRSKQIIGREPLFLSPKFQPDGSESKIKAREHIEAALAGKTQIFRWSHLRCNGSTFITEIILNLIKLGRQNLLQAIIHDVAKREFSELDAGFDKAKPTVWTVPLSDEATGEYFEPADMRIKILSESAENVFGFTPEEYAQKSPAGIFVPESFEYLSRIFAEERDRDKNPGVDPNRSIELELQHYHQNGSIVDIFVNIRAIRDSRGRIVGVQGTSRDMTSRKRIRRDLAVSQERYRELADLLPGSAFECDKNFMVTFLNKKAISTFGYNEDDVKRGLNILKAVSADDITRAIEYASRLLVDSSRSAYGIELTGIKSNGENFPVKLYGDIIYREGRPAGLRGIAIDITDQKAKENALRQSEERYRAIIENIEDGYYEVDVEGNLTYFNDAVLRITGYSREEMFGVNFRKFCNKGSRKNIFNAFRNAYRTHQPLRRLEWEIKNKNGEVRTSEISASLIEDSSKGVIGFRGIVRDVTERRRAEELIKQLAYHDFLTGLPNRHLFNDRLNMAMKYVDRNKSMLAIMMIDLDRFKEVNDTLGHQVGDLLLKAVARRLSDLVRKSDTVSRMGGDEFVMLLMTDITSEQDIASVAEKIIAAFDETIVCEGHPIEMTPSIGIALYPQHGHDIESLLRKADVAMYRVKESGRNNYKFYDFG
jgi:diguanylate cyclase (GGDEF)-like protein/PAS domain S-box-containing protein